MSSRTSVFALLAAGACLSLPDADAQEISEREAVRLFLSGAPSPESSGPASRPWKPIRAFGACGRIPPPVSAGKGPA